MILYIDNPKEVTRTSLAVQWLRLRASNAGGTGLISGWGTKIPHAMWYGHRKGSCQNTVRSENPSQTMFQDRKSTYKNNLHSYTLTVNCLKKDKTIPFTTKSKTMKHLALNFSKEMKNLYTENYNTLMKEIEEATNKWRDVLFLWLRRANIVKISILPKAIYRFSVIPNKFPMAVFIVLGENKSKILCSHKRLCRTKAILRKKQSYKQDTS